jgi:hypothetical protein
MFKRPISRRGWLLLIAAGGALLAAGRGTTTSQNYYPAYPVYGSTPSQVPMDVPSIQNPYPTYVDSSPGFNSAQVLAIGAAQREIAREMVEHTKRRINQ